MAFPLAALIMAAGMAAQGALNRSGANKQKQGMIAGQSGESLGNDIDLPTIVGQAPQPNEDDDDPRVKKLLRGMPMMGMMPGAAASGPAMSMPGMPMPGMMDPRLLMELFGGQGG